MIKCGIYRIDCLSNGEFYIGSAKDIRDRWYRHKKDLKGNKHHSIFMQRSFNKYGKDDFKFEIIEECTVEKLLEREQFYLDILSPKFNSYKIAGSSRGSKRTPEQIEVLRNRMIGNKHSLGYKHNEETRKKMAEASRNRIWSPESRNKLSNSLKSLTSNKLPRKPHKISTINKMRMNSPNKKVVMQYDLEGNFIKEWESAQQISRELGFEQASVTRCCLGKQKKGYKFKWKYKE